MPLPDCDHPLPTVDILIELPRGRLVLVRRKYPPLGWALPGGFVDKGESLEAAAAREAKEETGLAVRLVHQLHTYSDPARDPRRHTISTAFVARARGEPAGGDDAALARAFPLAKLPRPLCFDHAKIVADYRRWKRRG